MKKTIEKLRQRPVEDRKAVALLGSGVVMAVLLLGWSVATIGFFSHVTESQTAAAADAASSTGQ